MEKVLSGVRVLDFTDAMAWPYCATQLAACGCRVINLELSTCFDEPPSVVAGEHTEYALRDLLNLADEEIEKLQKESIIFSPESSKT